MSENRSVIEKFYQSFQKLDAAGMNACYSDYPLFNDPVFGMLEGQEVKAMWEMLCKNAKNFKLGYSDIQLLDDEYCTCRWTATYTFSRTGRKVVNEIKAHMRIQDGKITEHTDQFDFWKWSRQALGVSGWILGWSHYLRNKVHKSAVAGLSKYMQLQTA